VIATAITAALGAAAAAAVTYWHGAEGRAAAVWQALGREMLVPVWLVAGLALLAVLLSVLSMILWAWAKRAARDGGREVQPNAVLVEEAHVVEPPPALGESFEALSDEQRAFLRSLYRRGTRGFEMPDIQAASRWFERLERQGYVRAMDGSFAASGSTPYEITDAGWRELERALG
jgi:membrane protein implicated in regulation of membrane protease activity